jgi:hypothetical protein
MDSLSAKYLAKSYHGYLHADGKRLPNTGTVPLYDGDGNESSLSIGRMGEKAIVDGELIVGDLKYPENIGDNPIGSVATYLSSNEIGFEPPIRLFKDIINVFYPVGAIILTVNDDDPSTKYIGTTWERVGEAKVIIGVDDDGEFDVENNDGEFNKTITLPKHYHGVGRFSRGAIDWVSGSSNRTENNDNGIFIIAKDQPLPDKGWVSEDISYIARRAHGNSGTRGNDIILSDGYDQDKAIITTSQFSFDTKGQEPTIALNVTPPSYGVFIWKRTR